VPCADTLSVGANQTTGVATEVVAAALVGHGEYADGLPSLRAKGGDCAGGSEALIPACAFALNAHGGPHGRLDAESETLLPVAHVEQMPTMRAASAGAAHQQRSGDTRDEYVVPMAGPLYYTHDRNQDRIYGCDGIVPAVTASDSNTSRNILAPAPAAPIAFNHKEDRCFRAEEELTNPLRVGQTEAVCFEPGNLSRRCGSEPNSEVAPKVGATKTGDTFPCVAFQQNARDEVRLIGGEASLCGDSSAQAGMKQQNYVAQPWACRRLTVTECSRLQGFPDNYLDVIYRNKPAADGPRYKSLGNSMATTVIRWIGERIQLVLSRQPQSTSPEET